MTDSITTQPQAPAPAKRSGYRIKSISVSLEIADKEYGNGNAAYANIQAHVDDTPIEQMDDVIDAGLSLFVACWEVILGGKLAVMLNTLTPAETRETVTNVDQRLTKVQALPAQRTGSKRTKPYITPEQFDELVATGPYASMIYVAVYTGLRVSELAGLKWNDVIAIEQVNEKGELEVRYAISIDERFCRGDWGAPKSDASNATIGVNRCVYERIQRLKLLVVDVRAGTAVRRYRVVKADNPEDLVFQSVKKGAPMRDNNILSRHIKPAARKMGLGFVNWRRLRTSHATWLKMAGADVKGCAGAAATLQG